MIITYANYHRWSKTVIPEDVFDGFGKKSKKRLLAAIPLIDSANIRTEVTPVNADFLAWFMPMYETRINSKANPNVMPIEQRIAESDKQFFALQLFENEQPLGATIFSLPKANFSIAWRTYENSWTQTNFPINPSMYMEYIAAKVAIERGCKKLVHGKDSNPYGQNSSIGLAAFKFAVGSQPSKCKVCEIQTIDTDTVETDILVFEYPEQDEKQIKKGYLVTSRENEPKWTQVTKYPHLVDIETIYRD